MANLIGTAGHVDHGKTTLIKALTGIDADRLPEEKRRGLTIDIGFAYVDLPDVGRASIVDVPGHERFVTNMLVGALGTDVALLCVAADASVMPQTVEHFQILELLPVERMVVALTRADLADDVTLAVTREEVEELLAPTRFAGAPIVAVSATKGTGIEELKKALADAIKTSPKSSEGDWYMPVDRVFAIKGHGVVITGTMAQGTVREGDKAVLMPGGAEVRVRTIQSHEESKSSSEKGSRTALNVSGVKIEDLYRGQVIGAPGTVATTQVLDAAVRWNTKPKHGARVRVSIGADEGIARVFHNDYDDDLVQLRFERPVAAVRGQPFIVRRYSPPSLIGGGRVTVPEANVRRKNARVTTVVASAGETDSIVQVVASSEGGVHNDDLCRTLGKSAQALGGRLEELKNEGTLLGFAGLWMTQAQFEDASQKFCQALHALHESEPTKLAHPREAPVKSAGLKLTGKPLDRFVSRLTADGALRLVGSNVALAAFRVKFSDKQRVLLDRVLAELSKKGLSVPALKDVAAALHVPIQAVEEIVKAGVSAGEIVRIEDGMFVPATVLERTVASVRERYAGRRFSASEFRGDFETSRKFAIPVLEHLDAKGVTKRQGDERVVV